MDDTARPQPRPITSTANVVLASLVVCALAAALTARGGWPVVLHSLLTDGLFACAWHGAAVGVGASLLRLARMNFDSLALRFACAAALGLGVESILVLSLGLVGAVNRPVALAIVGIGLVLFAWNVATFVKHRPRVEVTPWSWLWLLVMPALGTALACAFVPPGILWGREEPNGYDVVSYHFQVPREWFELGRIVPLRHNVLSFFPFNVEMHYLLAMHLRGGPWAGMYLAQLMHVAFVALSVVVVFGVLREVGHKHAVVGAVAAASAPWLILLAPIGFNEGGLLLFGTLAIGLIMIAGNSSTPLRVAALAGAMAGFACGAKSTGVAIVLLSVPVALIGHRAIRRTAVYVLVGLATFSPWFIRNTAWTGNPAFPELTDVFGRAHFSERQVERWNRAHSPRPDQQSLGVRAGEFARQVLIDWRFGFALLPLAVVAAALSWRDRDSVYLQVLLLLLALFWLGLTHLQGRFFVLAIPIAALLVGRVANTRFTTGTAVILSLAAIVGVVMVQAKLRAAPGLVDVLGADSIIGATPLAGAPVSADDHVALVGEAKAFFYDLVPSQRLHYRTVFDVNVEPGESSVDAWLRGSSAPPGKTIVVIDPSELARFSRTYWQIPPPPEDVARSDAPVVIRK